MTTAADLPPLEALAALESAMGAALASFDAGLWRLGEAEAVDALTRTHRLGAQQTALHLSAVREVDTRGVATTQGAASTKAFLIGALTMSPALAGEQVRMSEALHTRFPDTRAALAERGSPPSRPRRSWRPSTASRPRPPPSAPATRSART